MKTVRSIITEKKSVAGESFGHTFLFAGIDESGEAVDVTAESRTECQQSVKPTHVGIDEAHHVADVEHGEKRPGTHDCPGP